MEVKGINYYVVIQKNDAHCEIKEKGSEVGVIHNKIDRLRSKLVISWGFFQLLWRLNIFKSEISTGR